MSGLRLQKAGILLQIQDCGRFGYGAIGITQSGSADAYSAAWANRLLLNTSDAPLLEILLGGASWISEAETVIAVTGAEAILEINGEERALWRSHVVKRGDHIVLGMARRGLRLYLAVKGGFACKKRLGSCATTLKEHLGQKIQAGELLHCGTSMSQLCRSVPEDLRPIYDDTMRLRVLSGYQSEHFSKEQKALFFSAFYMVTQATDRMGCRLQGDPVVYDGEELVSEPIAYGSIQIPSDGQPIVLLNERQTIGGYPKIGSVIPMDCYRLAQAKPGTKIRFEEIAIEDAVQKSRALMVFLGGDPTSCDAPSCLPSPP